MLRLVAEFVAFYRRADALQVRDLRRVDAALLDFGTWRTMSGRGLNSDEVEDVLLKLVLCEIGNCAAA